MSKVLIVFGTTGGNTQSVAGRIGKKLEGENHEVVVKNVVDSAVSELNDYEVLLLGSSTWNDGELQDDFVGFHMDMEDSKPDLSGKKFAAFGCGESIYENFCGAVDILEKTLTDLGASKITDGLKIDGYPEEDDNVEMTDKWASTITSSLA